MNSKDIPVEAGLYAAVSQDGLTLAVGLGPEVYAVAQLKTPIRPEEWLRLITEEWANPQEGALTRAVQRASLTYGLEAMIPATPFQADCLVLGNTISE